MPKHWKQKQSAIRHYDRTAETYDQQYMEEQNLKITAALKILQKPVDESAVVLDAGCGTGLSFPLIAVKAKQIVGVDISAHLLRKAKTKAEANTALIQTDADFLPLKTDMFTHAFAFTLLQNTPDPRSVIEEIKRVTRRDAALIMTGLKKHFTQATFIRLLKNAQLEVLSLKTDDRLKDFVAVCRKRL